PNTATYTLSLHDALPILSLKRRRTAIEAEMAKAAQSKDAPLDVAGLRKWAEEKLRNFGHAIKHGGTMHEMRQVVHSLVDCIEIRSEEHTSELQSRENLVC